MLSTTKQYFAVANARTATVKEEFARTMAERDVARADATKLKDRLTETLDKVGVANARAAGAEEELAKVKTERDEAQAEAAKWKGRYEETEAAIDALNAAQDALRARRKKV
jgi:chromosome segregation ATPase